MSIGPFHLARFLQGSSIRACGPDWTGNISDEWMAANTRYLGVYGGFVDKIPMGSAINRGLTFRMAQPPVQHYLPKLLEWIVNGDFVITHTVPLEKGPEMDKTFRDKQDGRIKVRIVAAVQPSFSAIGY